MTMRELLSWQWQGYPMYHRDRMNLLVHLAAVPAFMLANGLIIVAALRSSAVMLTSGIVALIVAVALQARGHSWERIPPERFTGVANFIGRLFLEQWVTFPRFVILGGWRANFRSARDPVSRQGPACRASEHPNPRS